MRRHSRDNIKISILGPVLPLVLGCLSDEQDSLIPFALFEESSFSGASVHDCIRGHLLEEIDAAILFSHS
jgi:hypothetical protein